MLGDYLCCLDSTTVVADTFQYFLDFVHEAIMKNGFGKFDDTKVARTFVHVLLASRAFEIAIDGTEMRIVWTFFTRF